MQTVKAVSLNKPPASKLLTSPDLVCTNGDQLFLLAKHDVFKMLYERYASHPDYDAAADELFYLKKISNRFQLLERAQEVELLDYPLQTFTALWLDIDIPRYATPAKVRIIVLKQFKVSKAGQK